MTNYKSITKKITPLILAAGLAGLVGCSEKFYNSTKDSTSTPTTTNELLNLALYQNGAANFIIATPEGKIEMKAQYEGRIRRDLANDSKPYVVEDIVHIPSNSTFKIPINSRFAFELQLNNNSLAQ
mgnify:FL=1